VSKSRQKRYKRKPGGGIYAALAILMVIILAVGGYMFFRPQGKKPELNKPTPETVQKLPLPGGRTRSDTSISPPPEYAPTLKNITSSGLAPHPAVSRQTGARGQLAIIIDDMGTSVQEARSLANIGVPVTFSIIPGLHGYREVAAFAASSGIETMIHIPMQPKGWPQRRLEVNGLLLSMDEAGIRAQMDEFMREIPNAVGANNHMGSEFTEHEENMRVVLESLKSGRLFFIDSMTSPQTVGQTLARELGIKTGRRNVFLDNEQNSAYIQGQLNQAVRIARKTGASIAICHPHPVTIKTLAALLPGLERQGITLVPVSRLVR
jgi:polysaccharide deacetylase 2 family uncharacterized protein YibQ